MPLPRACLPFSAPPLLLSAPTRSLNSPPILLPPSAPFLWPHPPPTTTTPPRSSPALPSFPPIIPDSFFLFFLLSLVCLLRVPHFSPTGRRPLIISRQRRRRSGLLPASLLLYCATPSEICIYDLRGLRPIQTVAASPSAGALKSVALLPDGRRALTAHQDGRVRVWRRSARSGRLRLAAALPTVPDRVRRLPSPAATSASAATAAASGSSTPTPSPPSPPRPPATCSTPPPGTRPSRSGAPPTSAASSPSRRTTTPSTPSPSPPTGRCSRGRPTGASESGRAGAAARAGGDVGAARVGRERAGHRRRRRRGGGGAVLGVQRQVDLGLGEGGRPHGRGGGAAGPRESGAVRRLRRKRRLQRLRGSDGEDLAEGRERARLPRGADRALECRQVDYGSPNAAGGGGVSGLQRQPGWGGQGLAGPGFGTRSGIPSDPTLPHKV
uniref:Uncharacterized protein n=1 Tax=Ananas comosus var. bracteatus TaxID=296719 RepID=A0A6V7Q1W1_ANACO|nr:unnamed protein product [Ananas comosus var. bracteatus]